MSLSRTAARFWTACFGLMPGRMPAEGDLVTITFFSKRLWTEASTIRQKALPSSSAGL
jgi:hypothetical protein